MHGDLTRPARVHLISLSPTIVPRGREFREADGMRGPLRGVWAGSETTDAFDLRGIPPGEYLPVGGGDGTCAQASSHDTEHLQMAGTK